YLDDVLNKFGFRVKWPSWIQGYLNSAIGLNINLHKSKLMGIGLPDENVLSVAASIGCSTFAAPFNFIGVKVDDLMSRRSFWEEVISKLSSRLSKWKLKTFSIGGRLTVIKSVLSSLPLYHMSIFKSPKGVLKHLESICQNFFNDVSNSDRRLALIGWEKIMASKKNAQIAEAAALSPSSFCKRYRSSYETPSPSLSSTLPIRKRYRGTLELVEDTKDESSNSDTKGEGLEDEGPGLEDEGPSSEDEGPGSEDEGPGLEDKGPGSEEEEVAPEGQQQAVLVVNIAMDKPLGIGYGALKRRELAL
nr:RNA-directed DNA polymerase, eukaryota [Tanacetum cinerariifolium]